MAHISTRRLNELLAEVLVRRSGLVVPDETAFKPYLPESYWHQRFLEEVVRETDAMNAVLQRKHDRAIEDRVLMETITVADVLEEGIPTLLGDNVGARSNWGRMPMRYSGGETKAPTPGKQQPSYHFECYQCGRPITVEGFDHGHQKLCDAALMPPDYEPYWEHTAKPWDGEEEDE